MAQPRPPPRFCLGAGRVDLGEGDPSCARSIGIEVCAPALVPSVAMRPHFCSATVENNGNFSVPNLRFLDITAYYNTSSSASTYKLKVNGKTAAEDSISAPWATVAIMGTVGSVCTSYGHTQIYSCIFPRLPSCSFITWTTSAAHLRRTTALCARSISCPVRQR